MAPKKPLLPLPPDPGFMYIGQAEGMSPEIPESETTTRYGQMPDPPRYVRHPLYTCLMCFQIVLHAGQARHRCWEGLC